MLFKFALALSIIIVFVIADDLEQLEQLEHYDNHEVQWVGGSFEWPCATTKSMFKNSGRYISKNVIATRAAIFNDEAFLALPRYRSGIPATLARVSLKDRNCQASLHAFPCWSIQEEGSLKALQNVVDLFLDPQDILWVLDTGVIHTLEESVRMCQPKVVAFDVKTGKLLKTVELDGLTTSSSRLQYVVADYSPDGRVFVYVSDAATRAILVYDVTSGRGYRFVLPKIVTMNSSRRDVLYLALIRHADGSTCLMFTYLSSSHMFSIKTEYLRNGLTSGKIQDVGTKPKRLVILGTDNGNALFFRYEGDGIVQRWDTNTPFQPENFQKVYNSAACSLATHVIPDYRRNSMRVLESNFPDYIEGTVGCGANQALNIM
ncbi:PREDICTED: major royal jelly protein 1-like [Polistes dominula]|uniref:Major royal jelly protein 1-like n=1 Tax=Polistes dominula TaxID=743375 RepID=A0ABM1I108_POLDO|nr:PREDICTED: major royal jelly protein 1-like [Polistes dominula]